MENIHQKGEEMCATVGEEVAMQMIIEWQDRAADGTQDNVL
jgi:hypothetical protein